MFLFYLRRVVTTLYGFLLLKSCIVDKSYGFVLSVNSADNISRTLDQDFSPRIADISSLSFLPLGHGNFSSAKIYFECIVSLSNVASFKLGNSSQAVLSESVAIVSGLPLNSATYKHQSVAVQLGDLFSLAAALTVHASSSDLQETMGFNVEDLYVYLSNVLIDSVTNGELTAQIQNRSREYNNTELAHAVVDKVDIFPCTEEDDEISWNRINADNGLIVVIVFAVIVAVFLAGFVTYKKVSATAQEKAFQMREDRQVPVLKTPNTKSTQSTRSPRTPRSGQYISPGSMDDIESGQFSPQGKSPSGHHVPHVPHVFHLPSSPRLHQQTHRMNASTTATKDVFRQSRSWSGDGVEVKESFGVNDKECRINSLL